MDEREERMERYAAAALTLWREVAHDLAHEDPERAEKLREIIAQAEALLRG